MLAAAPNKENSVLDKLFEKNTTTAEEVVPSTVYINCAPAMVEYTTAEEWLKEEQTEWQKLNKIDYIEQYFTCQIS